MSNKTFPIKQANPNTCVCWRAVDFRIAFRHSVKMTENMWNGLKYENVRTRERQCVSFPHYRSLGADIADSKHM